MHYKDKNLQIDIRCHTVFMNDQKIELSLKEFTVLKYLTEHPGWYSLTRRFIVMSGRKNRLTVIMRLCAALASFVKS